MAILTQEQEFNIYGEQSILNPGARQMLDYLEDNPPIASLQELDSIPKPMFQAKPIYPTELLVQKVTGKAVIKYLIDEKGHVQLPEIASATDDNFGWAALTAVSQWRFEPPKRNGNTVIVRTETPIRFETTQNNASK